MQSRPSRVAKSGPVGFGPFGRHWAKKSPEKVLNWAKKRCEFGSQPLGGVATFQTEKLIDLLDLIKNYQNQSGMIRTGQDRSGLVRNDQDWSDNFTFLYQLKNFSFCIILRIFAQILCSYKDICTHTCAKAVNALMNVLSRAHTRLQLVRVCACTNLHRKKLVDTSFLMNLNFIFFKYLSFYRE